MTATTTVLTVKEAAGTLGVGPEFIQRRCKRGEISSFKVGADYRIHQADLDAWLARTQQEKPSSLPTPKRPVREAPDLLTAIDNWLAYLTNVKALSKETIRTHREHVRSYLKRVAALGSVTLTAGLLVERQTLMGVFTSIPVASYATKANTYNALVSFAKHLAMEGLVPASTVDELRAFKPRRQSEPRRTSLKAEELKRLFDVILTRPNAVADNLTVAAMVAVMAYAGLRVSEVCNLKPDDVDLPGRVLTVFHGKGGKNRRVGISQALYAYLKDYQAIRPASVWYFAQSHGAGYDRNMLAVRMRVLSRRLGKPITCHGLRRTMATLASSQGRNINALRLALGHAQIQTTQAYLMTSEAEVVADMAGW